MTTAARAQALARKTPTPVELERRHGARNYDPLKVILERPHPAVALRCGEVDPGGEIDVAGPPIRLERAKNLAVDVIQGRGHHAIIAIRERIMRQEAWMRMI